jgi:hypothetical protein
MDSSRLTKNDVLLLSGGVKDVYNNNSKNVILQIVKFLQDNDNANKIMLDILHRYDLSDTCNSFVNKETKALNSKLKKIKKLFNHGLNLNGFRRGLLAKQITSLIYEISGKKKEEPFSIKWKMELN